MSDLPLRITGPGQPIGSMWSWFAAAPPEGGDRQWKNLASAKELARAWAPQSGQVRPPEVMLTTLRSHPDLMDLLLWDVMAEAVTPLDTYGRGRQHDLVAIGRAHVGPVLVAVEAKAEESFGSKSIADELAAGLLKSGSHMPERITALVRALPGQKPVAVRHGGRLPSDLGARGYQLLTATVGTAIEAARRNCAHAVLLVHAFRRATPTPKKAQIYKDSDDDLNAFAEVLGAGPVPAGGVAGPVVVRAGTIVPEGVAVYLAKCVTFVG